MQHTTSRGSVATVSAVTLLGILCQSTFGFRSLALRIKPRRRQLVVRDTRLQREKIETISDGKSVELWSSANIDLQCDSTQFGRGEMHLSAILSEGKDVVAYQIGSWLVDGVTVGDESKDPSIAYCCIETIQIVWTHNCEHGVLRGQELQRLDNDSDDDTVLISTGELVEFGPEQLIARIPVKWNGNNDDYNEWDPRDCTPLVLLDEASWIQIEA